MPYDITRILELLPIAGPFSGNQLNYFDLVDSTNSWMLEQPNVAGKICLAEQQSAGRGRRGNIWVDHQEGSVLMSLGWAIDGRSVSGLSLASGLAVSDALGDFGVTDIKLKWPNDIILSGKKLGGILVELSGQKCVIGIGLNISIDSDQKAKQNSQIDQPWVDLKSQGFEIQREDLVCALVQHHQDLIDSCVHSGFGQFMQRWNQLHAHHNKEVEVYTNNHRMVGIARGVDETGALLLDQPGGRQKVVSGEVSLRQL